MKRLIIFIAFICALLGTHEAKADGPSVQYPIRYPGGVLTVNEVDFTIPMLIWLPDNGSPQVLGNACPSSPESMAAVFGGNSGYWSWTGSFWKYRGSTPVTFFVQYGKLDSPSGRSTTRINSTPYASEATWYCESALYAPPSPPPAPANFCPAPWDTSWAVGGNQYYWSYLGGTANKYDGGPAWFTVPWMAVMDAPDGRHYGGQTFLANVTTLWCPA